MKKHLTIGIITITLLLFVGCNNVNKEQGYSENGTDTIFTQIQSGSRFSIYKENRTDVMYVVYHAGYKGGLTVMLDENGNPLLYKNWKNK